MPVGDRATAKGPVRNFWASQEFLASNDSLKVMAPLYYSMALQPATYFREHDDDDIKGFTVIESTPSQVRIAEKSISRGRWYTYWVPTGKLNARVEVGHCEQVGSLTDDQFEQVCDRTDQRVTV